MKRVSSFEFRVSSFEVVNPEPGTRNPEPGVLLPAVRSYLIVWLVLVGMLFPTQGSGEQKEYIPSGVPDVMQDQRFLYRPGKGYTNYAFRDYEISQEVFSAGSIKRNYYDPLGSFLTNGRHLFTWRETRQTNAVEDGSALFKDRFGTFQNVIVGMDSYNSWSGAIIMGLEIQSHLTPLTLDMSDFNGVRMDLLTPKNALTLMASRIGHPGFLYLYQEVKTARNSVMALAGHYERRIGGLRLGATFVNQHGFDSRQEDWPIKGGLQSDQPLPSFLVVRIADDSPRDGRGGPVAQDMRIFVNGRLREDLRPDIIKTNSQFPSAFGTKNAVTGEFKRADYNHQGTRYVEYLYYKAYLAGEDVSNAMNVKDMVNFFKRLPNDQVAHADGYDVLLYFVDLTGESYVRSVDFDVLVGNDYRIDVFAIHEINKAAKDPAGRYNAGGFLPVGRSVGAEGQIIHQITQEPLSIRAEGNVQDLSNMKRISFSAGKFTGMSIMGTNLNIDVLGLKVNAEYATSFSYQQYPDGRPGQRETRDISGVRRWNGAHFERHDPAYYINAIKQFGWLELGGEYFSIHPNYNVTYDFEMVQDNDDDDRWSDRGAYWGLYAYTTGDPFGDADGVFPGNDEDNDGIPDTNRDEDGFPDYQEPFLMYDVEPNAYAYGPDFNNNDVPDEREDDQDPDLPYERDLRGYNTFARINLTKSLGLTVGKLDSKGIAGGGNNKADYAEVRVEKKGVHLRRIFFKTELKRIHDDIEDPYRSFQEVWGPPPRTSLGFVGSDKRAYRYFDAEDQRFYRNSIASRNTLNLTSKRFHGALVESKARFDINWQQESLLNDGTHQPQDRVLLLALVNKADYLYQPTKKWRLVWQAKLMNLRRTRQSLEVPLVDEWTFMPIFKASYQISPNTEIWFGGHGFPGLEHRFKDRAKPRESFTEQTLVSQVVSRSEYYGYNITTSLGMTKSKRTYDDILRKEENKDIVSAYLRVYLSFNQ